jgi:ribosomal-protein-alanine N-acetyltransferase
LSSEPSAPQAQGERVWVCAIRAQDVGPYRLAVEQSRRRLSRWNPVDPEDLERQLPVQSRDRRTFLIHALAPEGAHDIVGKVNVTDVVRGRFESAAVGYDAYDPYAGRGLFAEGLRLVIGLAFAQESLGGMGLHRVAAAVQPGNPRSAGLLRSLGFQREGFSPRLLWLPGEDGSHAWQDHVSYVLRREEWPTQPYARARARRIVALVNGLPGSGRATLARELADELQVPLFAEDAMMGDADRALWELVHDSPIGAVVEGRFGPDDAPTISEGLVRCGLDPATVPEMWCQSAQVQTAGAPVGLGPTVAVDTDGEPGRAVIVRIALQVLAAGLLPASET